MNDQIKLQCTRFEWKNNDLSVESVSNTQHTTYYWFYFENRMCVTHTQFDLHPFHTYCLIKQTSLMIIHFPTYSSMFTNIFWLSSVRSKCYSFVTRIVCFGQSNVKMNICSNWCNSFHSTAKSLYNKTYTITNNNKKQKFGRIWWWMKNATCFLIHTVSVRIPFIHM